MLRLSKNTLPTLAGLPDEIKINIVRCLAVQGIAQLRLVSREWADLGAEQLFRGGFIVPHLPGISRLLEASDRPLIAKGIKLLVLYVPEVKPNAVKKAVANSVPCECCSFDNASIWEGIDSRIPSLISDPAHVAHLSTETFGRILGSFPKLDTLVIKSTSLASWYERDEPMLSLTPNHFPTCFSLHVSGLRCSNILRSVKSLQVPLRKLVLDPLPLSTFFLWTPATPRDFERPTHIFKALEQGLAQLQDLAVIFDGGEDSSDAAIEAFGRFFKCMPKLQSLTIRFSAYEGATMEFVRSFLKSRFQALTNLICICMPCLWADLSTFLLNHKGTLKRVAFLGGMAVDLPPYAGGGWDWEEVLTEVRDNLSLECFMLNHLPTDEALYVIGNCYDGTADPDHTWESLDGDAGMNSFHAAGLCEQFVKGEKPWLMLDPAIVQAEDWEGEQPAPTWNINWVGVSERLELDWELHYPNVLDHDGVVGAVDYSGVTSFETEMM